MCSLKVKNYQRNFLRYSWGLYLLLYLTNNVRLRNLSRNIFMDKAGFELQTRTIEAIRKLVLTEF
jgi:hypothetical protein